MLTTTPVLLTLFYVIGQLTVTWHGVYAMNNLHWSKETSARVGRAKRLVQNYVTQLGRFETVGKDKRPQSSDLLPNQLKRLNRPYMDNSMTQKVNPFIDYPDFVQHKGYKLPTNVNPNWQYETFILGKRLQDLTILDGEVVEAKKEGQKSRRKRKAPSEQWNLEDESENGGYDNLDAATSSHSKLASDMHHVTISSDDVEDKRASKLAIKNTRRQSEKLLWRRLLGEQDGGVQAQETPRRRKIGYTDFILGA